MVKVHHERDARFVARLRTGFAATRALAAFCQASVITSPSVSSSTASSRTVVEPSRCRVARHDLDAASFGLDEHENAELGQGAERRVTPQRVRANVAADQANLDEELQPRFFARRRDRVPDLVALA